MAVGRCRPLVLIAVVVMVAVLLSTSFPAASAGRPGGSSKRASSSLLRGKWSGGGAATPSAPNPLEEPAARKPPPTQGYVRRTAGPPAPFAQVFLWSSIGTAAFATFIWIPRMLRQRALTEDAKRAGQPKKHLPPGEVLMLRILEDNASGNDLLAAAEHLHLSLWIMVAFDILVRLVSLCILSERQLYIQQFLPLDVTTNTTAAQREISLKCWGLTQINLVRDAIVGVDRLHIGGYCNDGVGAAAVEDGWSPAPYAKPRGLFEPPDPYNVRHVTCIALAVSFALWAVWAWRTHIRLFIAGALPSQQPLPKERQYTPRAPAQILSTRCVVALWTVCYLGLFAYTKAMPLFMGFVFPGAVICVSIFCVFLP